MKQKNLEELTTDQLAKRKTFLSIVLGIIVGLLILNVVVGVLERNSTLFATSAVLLTTGFPVFQRIAKIKAEIDERRGEQRQVSPPEPES